MTALEAVLEPCPFCGDAPQTTERTDSTFAFVAFIACMCGGYSACAHKMGKGSTAEEARAKAIAAWNTRTHGPAMLAMERDGEDVPNWRDGAPSNPWDGEWFIAETTYGDRVVLRKLPEEYAYDFTTADETYFKREKIARWIQFPDSIFISPADTALSAIGKVGS